MDESDNQRDKLANFRLLYLILQMVGITIIVLMASWVFVFLGGVSWSSTPSIQFNWHPLLMTVGMIYLYGNTILIYRGLRYTPKRSLKLTHATLFGFIFVLILIAGTAVYQSHVLANPPIPNFYSLHSWVGITAMLLFVFQWIGGFVTFLYPQVRAPLKETIMPFHIYFGLTGYVLAVAAALLGISEKVFFHNKELSTFPNEGVLVNCIAILIVFFAGLVVFLATKPNYKRIPLPEDAILLTGHDE